MIVTIDSNIFSISELIAGKLHKPATRWCTQYNRCDDIANSSPKDEKIFYNTPVSMSSDVTYYQFPTDTIHFVYVDFSYNIEILKHILSNIKHLSNVVVLSNGKSYATGQYVLYPGNCTDEDIAEVIGGIIVLHLKEKRAIPQRELIALLCGKSHSAMSRNDKDQSVGDDKTNTKIKIYNIYDILDAKQSNFTEISDCHECKK